MKSSFMTKPKHGGKTRNRDQSSTKRKTRCRKEVKVYTMQKKKVFQRSCSTAMTVQVGTGLQATHSSH